MKKAKIISKYLNNKNFNTMELFGVSYVSAFAPKKFFNKENISFLDKKRNILFIRCNDEDSLSFFEELIEKAERVVIFFNYKYKNHSNVIIDNEEIL